VADAAAGAAAAADAAAEAAAAADADADAASATAAAPAAGTRRPLPPPQQRTVAAPLPAPAPYPPAQVSAHSLPAPGPHPIQFAPQPRQPERFPLRLGGFNHAVRVQQHYVPFHEPQLAVQRGRSDVPGGGHPRTGCLESLARMRSAAVHHDVLVRAGEQELARGLVTHHRKGGVLVLTQTLPHIFI